MKKILTTLFVTFGVLFFILIFAVIIFIAVDPFGLRSLPGSNITVKSVFETAVSNNQLDIDNIDKNPLMNESQEAVLESIGVNPSDLPAEITPSMEECFIGKLGEERVEEIIQGGSPTVYEFLRASDCF